MITTCKTPDDSEWFVIEVFADGNPVDLGGPYYDEDQAEEACFEFQKKRDMIK